MKISEQEIKKICSPAIYKRGMDYFNQGRVHIKNRDAEGFTAVVDGERLYNVSVKFTEDGGIKDFFCTCPYYDTMGTACKHIAAAVEERRRELSGDTSAEDGNEKIAELFISEFSKTASSRIPLNISFEVTFRPVGRLEMRCEVLIYISGKYIDSPEEFLESFTNRRPYRLGRKTDYHRDEYTFGEAEEKILSILAESYESRAVSGPGYVKSSGSVAVGAEGIKRLMPLLPEVDYEIVIDRMKLGRVPVTSGNPEVLIDISAVFGEITLHTPNYGLCLVPDAGVFYYENIIYLTDSGFREKFLPIYRALAADCRSQLVFRGENALSFAALVLPRLENEPGVVTDGLDEYVIKEKPVFTVFIDCVGRALRCKIKADYGVVSFFLPDNGTDTRYIVVRDAEVENEVLSFFEGFQYKNGFYETLEDEIIFDFLTARIEKIKQLCTVVESDLFSGIKIKRSVPVSADISYNTELKLLEATPLTELSADEIQSILSAVRLKKRFYRTRGGDFFDIASVTDEMLFFERLFSENGAGFEAREIPEYNMLYLCAAADSENRKIRCSAELTEYIESIRSIKPVIPEHLSKTLRDYQKTGALWLKQLSALGFGGILADDMGLGKTVQILSFLYAEKRTEPALIVTPAALTYNWLHEFKKFIPEASVMLIDGSRDERKKKIEHIKDYEFVIVSYPLLRRDIESYGEIEFSFCVLDEAQAIKNPHTMNASSVKKIHARRRFALTGTPIENSLKELWSIFDFLMPGYLGSYEEFRSVYELPIIRDGSAAVMNELRAKIRPFLLRRMKSDVLSELPEKVEEILYANMTEEQEKMYIAYREIAKNRALAILAGEGKANLEMLTLILRLRQISCHPSLFDVSYKKGSGKLDVLYELLASAVSSGHRVLVFSQFTSMLSIISTGLKERGVEYFYIDGSTPARRRLELCDRFNGGEREVFLISLKAGGTGLNLTGADTVIHYDPWWNPAVTDQASDRAYRIGQDKSVHVIRMACENTIEAKIIELQEKKRSLAEDVININSSSLSSLSTDEILSLFE